MLLMNLASNLYMESITTKFSQMIFHGIYEICHFYSGSMHREAKRIVLGIIESIHEIQDERQKEPQKRRQDRK